MLGAYANINAMGEKRYVAVIQPTVRGVCEEREVVAWVLRAWVGGRIFSWKRCGASRDIIRVPFDLKLPLAYFLTAGGL